MDEFTIYMIIQRTKSLLLCFFTLNLKIYKILQSTIRSFDPQSHLAPTIQCRIPILTTLGLDFSIN